MSCCRATRDRAKLDPAERHAPPRIGRWLAADASARSHGGVGVAVVTKDAGAFDVVYAITGARTEPSPVW
jgi:hypothetical protein